MRPHLESRRPQRELLQVDLERLIDIDHPLVRLGLSINWSSFEETLGSTYHPSPTAILCGILQAIRPASAATSSLVPEFEGAYFSHEWKEALWANYYTGAPARQRQSVERYSIVKRV